MLAKWLANLRSSKLEMDDIISLSSGSGEDSDVEVVGVYSDTENKAEAIPFIRGGWVNLAAYTPVSVPREVARATRTSTERVCLACVKIQE